MRRMTLCMAVLVAAAPVPLIAHPEPAELGEFRGPTTSELAVEAISNLVRAKKLPASWNSAKLTSFDLRSKNGTDQYVLIFENPAIKVAGKRKLYVLMGTGGQFISAGYKLS